MLRPASLLARAAVVVHLAAFGGSIGATAAAIGAQEPTNAAEVTEPGRTIERALDVVLGGGDGGERSLVVLLERSPDVQRAGFADAFAAAIARNAARLTSTRIAVVPLGGERAAITFAPDPATAALSARLALTAVDKRILNVYASLRDAATGLAGKPGAREILLVTLNNGDAEDDLEATVARLQRASIRVHVLTSEAYLADTYWTRRTPPQTPRGCRMTGGDAPFVDLPHGWLFQMVDANEIAPAGVATYGLNRVAAATGGRVHLYTPPEATVHKCAVYGSCLFCTGDHVAESETFWSARVALLAASVKSRTAAAAELGQDPYHRATVKAWRDAQRAGLCASGPPRLGSTASGGGDARGAESLLLMFSSNLERNAERADQAAKEARRIHAALEADLARIDPAKAQPRQRAIAEFTRLMLQLTEVNLVTFAAWCRDVAPGWLAKSPPTPAPPEISPLFSDERAGGIGFTNYCLCHGATPFVRVELPGGAPLRDGLLRLAELERAFLELHGHSPFAIGWHRQGVARFHLTYPGYASTIDRDRGKSKSAPDPTTTSGERPPRGGTTGSGGASGPTTGGRE